MSRATNPVVHDQPVNVTIRARVDAGSLYLDIIDTGRGLTAEFADVIFQPYVRADGAGPGAGTLRKDFKRFHWMNIASP